MRRLIAILAVPFLVLLAACGTGAGDGAPEPATAGEDRTVEIEMRDIAFSPTEVDVRTGETIRFVFTNRGTLTHDAFIGDAAAQEQHEQDARRGHDHGGSGNSVSVKPGRRAQLVHTFDRPGRLLIGCHEPGHYTGGMKVAVNVS